MVRVQGKEYILVIKRTAVSSKDVPTQPLPALSVVYVDIHILQLPDCLTEQAGRGCVDTSLEDAGGCCAFYHNYIFFGSGDLIDKIIGNENLEAWGIKNEW